VVEEEEVAVKYASGPGRRRLSVTLESHVPIRFTNEAVEKVKCFADKDNKTVSSWIRDLVDEEIERREAQA
jgi:predicted DNA-binding protein